MCRSVGVENGRAMTSKLWRRAIASQLWRRADVSLHVLRTRGWGLGQVSHSVTREKCAPRTAKIVHPSQANYSGYGILRLPTSVTGCVSKRARRRSRRRRGQPTARPPWPARRNAAALAAPAPRASPADSTKGRAGGERLPSRRAEVVPDWEGRTSGLKACALFSLRHMLQVHQQPNSLLPFLTESLAAPVVCR